jgi:RNA polymerase sigma factor (sigma-70 family)
MVISLPHVAAAAPGYDDGIERIPGLSELDAARPAPHPAGGRQGRAGVTQGRLEGGPPPDPAVAPTSLVPPGRRRCRVGHEAGGVHVSSRAKGACRQLCGHRDQPVKGATANPAVASARILMVSVGGDIALMRRRPVVDDLSDEALLNGLAVGEAGMDVAFVRRFQRRVYGLAFNLVGDQALAEDVAQEAFLRAWRHAPVFDSRRGSVATWLLAITRNLAIDALRLRRAVPTDPGSLLSVQDEDRGPDTAAVASDAAARLRGAIATLPLDQRRALVLAAFYGHTADEISTAEGIPLGTAKTRIRAGMQKLRLAMIDQGSES